MEKFGREGEGSRERNGGRERNLGGRRRDAEEQRIG